MERFSEFSGDEKVEFYQYQSVKILIIHTTKNLIYKQSAKSFQNKPSKRQLSNEILFDLNNESTLLFENDWITTSIHCKIHLHELPAKFIMVDIIFVVPNSMWYSICNNVWSDIFCCINWSVFDFISFAFYRIHRCFSATSSFTKHTNFDKKACDITKHIFEVTLWFCLTTFLNAEIWLHHWI